MAQTTRFTSVLPERAAKRTVHGTVIDGLPCVVFRLRATNDRDAPVFSMVSERARELLEIEPAVMVLEAATFFDRIVSEDAERVLTGMQRALAQMTEWREEFRLRTGQGERWFEVRALAHSGSGGARIIDGVLLDITDSGRSAAHADAIRARDDFVFDAAPQPIVIAGNDGSTKAVNRAFVNTFGFRAEDVPDRVTRNQKMIRDPAERERLVRLWTAAFRRYQDSGLQPDPLVARVCCMDGSERLVEVRARFGPSESITILTDISETVRSETERQRILADREELRNELGIRSNLLPMALVISDPSDALTIRDWNPAAERIFGYTRDEVIGASAYEKIVPPDGHEYVRGIIRRSLDSPETITSIGRNVTKDGRTIWCEWSTTAVRESHGAPAHVISLVQDVTDRLAADERRRLWTSVLEQSSEGILICDPQRRILLVNAAFERLTGYSAAEVIGKSPAVLRSGRQDEAFYKEMWSRIAANDHWSGEIWNRRKGGEIYPEWLSLSVVRDEQGNVSHYVGIFSDITERKAVENRMQRLAHYDALTDLPNRALLLDRLEQLVELTRRENKSAAVMFIDLDRFKEVNDSLGHDAGDQLLQAMVRRITSVVRKSDTVARMGGDEFVVLLPGLDADGAADLAEKLLKEVASPLMLGEHQLCVSASIGICVIPDDGETAGELLRNADAAMYRAKRGGRNTSDFYTRELNDRAKEKLRTESALRNAVERNELVLHYQPQIDVRTGMIVGAEALVRWNRPGVGLIPPGQFIPLAQERGLIAAIDQWVVLESVRQVRAWDAAGLPPLTIAVNISATDFHSKGFVESLAQMIGREGIAASRIELELTEGVAVRDVAATTAILRELHRLGFRISLDDFGTGYSSLNYLRNFPIDKIKIDRSFVSELNGTPHAIRTVRAIIGLAKSYSMTVIAEGVEVATQLAALRAEGCDEFQGYLAAPPLPQAEFAKLQRAWKPLW